MKSDRITIKRALVSVYDKTHLIPLGKSLVAAGIKLYSSSGTYQALKEAHIAVETVESLTAAAEILDGRVKTLHPKIHGAILMNRHNPAHLQTTQALDIKPLDLIVINLYPFEKVSQPTTQHANPNTPPDEISLEAALEMIDIGGPTLLRAAAKNFPFVTVLSDPNDYHHVSEHIAQTGGTPRSLREQLALKAFQHTAHYDSVIARRLESKLRHNSFTYIEKTTQNNLSQVHAHHSETPKPFNHAKDSKDSKDSERAQYSTHTQHSKKPRRSTKLDLEGSSDTPSSLPNSTSTAPMPLRYGENPHQQAVLKVNPPHLQEPFSLAKITLLSGAPLSYNNLLDTEAAIGIIRDLHFTLHPLVPASAVVIKHGTPCGLACAQELAHAMHSALEGDVVSRYGSVIAVTQKMDAQTAQTLKKIFVEIVIAPEYTPAALELLHQKNKRMRILSLPDMLAKRHFPASMHSHPLESATLLQARDEELFSDLEVVTNPTVTDPTQTATPPSTVKITPHHLSLDHGLLHFTNIAVKHTKSNAIAIGAPINMPHSSGSGGYMLLGLGAGQPNRLDAVQKLAIPKMLENVTRLYPKEQIPTLLKKVVLASDAFFPFPDSLTPIHESGIRTIIQPGGSIRDPDIIAQANRLGLTMIFTHRRHFLH